MLVSRAEAYAANRGTTITAIVCEHLNTIAGDDPLLTHSKGRLARSEAIRLLGLRDPAALLVTLEMPLVVVDAVYDALTS